MFFRFDNGLCINDKFSQTCSRQRNHLPIISYLIVPLLPLTLLFGTLYWLSFGFMLRNSLISRLQKSLSVNYRLRVRIELKEKVNKEGHKACPGYSYSPDLPLSIHSRHFISIIYHLSFLSFNGMEYIYSLSVRTNTKVSWVFLQFCIPPTY